jgi:glutamate synthase (NADPH/NADH) small chain
MDGARREGVRLVEHAKPVEVMREAGALTGLRVVDAKSGEQRVLPCDLVVVAIGQAKLREIVAEFPEVALDDKGRVAVDESSRRTGNAKVWAGGDCINGGAEVVNAAADGREAARAMLRAWGM